jgi:apolipoprotein N-acyltransferase
MQMRLDPNPIFRKAIIPWYDSNLACWTLLIAMIVIVLFSWAGIDIAYDIPMYTRYAWVPWLLLLLSLATGLSVAYRLARRYYMNHLQIGEP